MKIKLDPLTGADDHRIAAFDSQTISPYPSLPSHSTRRPTPVTAFRHPNYHLPVHVADPFAPFESRGESDDDSSLSSDESQFSEGEELDEKVDESDRLVGRERDVEEGSRARWTARGKAASRKRLMWLTGPPAILAAILAVTFIGSQLFRARGQHTFHGQGLARISLHDLATGVFSPDRKRVEWLAEAGDGVYSYRTDQGSIMLVDVGKNTTRTLVEGSSIRDESGNKLPWTSFHVSADLKYILFGADTVSQWRWSSHSNFYIHTIATGYTYPLVKPDPLPHTAIARFSPRNHHIAYVHANDLYVLEGPKENDGTSDQAIRVTIDGGPTTFNAIPDWVYEEEVFGGDSAIWWSPDGSKLAYISFDEHAVPEYEFPIYNPSSTKPGANPYPTSTVMRYPKPGYPNPKVKLHVFDLAQYLSSATTNRPVLGAAPKIDPHVQAYTYQLSISRPFAEDDEIIMEVTWVGDNDLMVRATDRIARTQRVAHFVFGTDLVLGENNEIVGQVVRDDDFQAIDGGWAESGQTIQRLITDSSSKHETPTGYLDIVPDSKGFNHIAYFSPPDSKTPVFLTTGEWEVQGGIQSVDISRGIVYFIAANPSIERHLYSIPLPTTASLPGLRNGGIVPPTVLSNTTAPGYYSVQISPLSGFYVLNYDGPEIPWQRLISVDDSNYYNLLTDNHELAIRDAAFLKSDISYHTVKSEGFDLNVVELRPPSMDLSGRTKYPILFQVYGGPGSQKVATAYSRDWHHYLCTTHNYVIVTVDPRGTGMKGRAFRMPIRNRLGELEALDVVNAARDYSALPFIDEERVGIWGWSYGGYLTNKIVETNSSVFTTALSVAPVSDWRYYDSIYTERYMSTPQLNPKGYDASAVTKMEGFKHVDFSLSHGSGDDNVHLLNSAALLDRLTSAHVRGFRFRMFTDSDHSISTREAHWELMQSLTDFLVEKWGEVKRKSKVVNHKQ